MALRIVKPAEATGHSDEVVDAVVPVESVEVDGNAVSIQPALDPNAKPPEGGHFKHTPISELINGCNAAVDVMSNHNAHKHLLWNCGFALRQLVDRLAERDAEIVRLKAKVGV